MTSFTPVSEQIEIGHIPCRPILTAWLVVAADLLVLAFAGFAAVYGRLFFGGVFDPAAYIKLWPILGIFIVVNKLRGLYPAHGLNEIEELRRQVTTTTVVCTTLAACIFLFKEGADFSRILLLVFSALAIFLLPLGRALLRRTCGFKDWWGMPVAVVGEHTVVRKVIKSLLSRPELGLRPVAVLSDDLVPGCAVQGVLVLGGLARAAALAKEKRISTAVIALSRVQDADMSANLGRLAGAFPNVLMVADMKGFSTLWVEAHGLGQFLTLHVRHGLKMWAPQLLKRSLDVGLTLLLSLLVLPIVIATAIAVKLTSRGPIFYGQTRVGQDNRRFKAWKFRTMVQNADAILFEYLGANPETSAEWLRNHKLKDDPRITPIGRFLRRASIDELPQFWNVLRGEMSLVGPRPIVEAEIEKYADQFDCYSKVPPGITGLWQVSGRNNTTYAERVELDCFYVNNWSPWLDLYLLSRTIRAVINKDGAY
jgi:Undecaprenyl-phosphate galactose phosphotransferase WbaP